MIAEVTFDTNDVVAFARAHLGAGDDDAVAQLIAWNREWFAHNPTAWLPIGRKLYISAPPLTAARPVFTIGGQRLVIDGAYMHIPTGDD